VTAWKDNVLILCICLVAWGLSLPLRDSSCPPGWNYGSDTTTYLDLAANIQSGKGYVHGPGAHYYGANIDGPNVSTYHNVHILPGYPLLLVAGNWAVGPARSPYAVAFLLFFLLMVCTFAMARRLFGTVLPKRWLWIAFILFFALQPIFILQLQAIGRDLASTTFLTIYLYALLVLFQRERAGFAVILATLAGLILAASVRTNIFAFLLPLLVGLVGYFGMTHHSRKALIVAVNVAVAVACILAWGFYLRQYTGRFLLGTDQGSSLYTNFIFPLAPPAEIRRDENAANALFQSEIKNGLSIEHAMADTSDFYHQRTIDYLHQHPSHLGPVTVKNIARTFWEKDYYWLPKLLYVKWRAGGLDRYEQFRAAFRNEHSRVVLALFGAFYAICYLLYIAVPVVSLILFPVIVGIRVIKSRSWAGSALPETFFLAAGWALAALIFLGATSILGAAQPRYRMPVAAVSYLSLLGILGWWRLRRGGHGNQIP